MADLISIAAKEAYLGRRKAALQICRIGLRWSFHRSYWLIEKVRSFRSTEAKNGDLINRKARKELALRWAQDHRTGWLPSQVSKQFLDDLNSRVRLLVQGSINRHRSVGQTIRDLF